MTTIDPEVLANATPAELAAIEKQAKLEFALLSPLDFAAYVNPRKAKRFPHSELLSRYSMAVIDHALYDSGIGPKAVWAEDPEDPDDGAWRHPVTGEEAHDILIISMPPRHGKSWIITETVPAWQILRDPDTKVIVTGYEADFAKGFGRKNREKIEDHPEFGIMVNQDVRAADGWTIKDHDGGMWTAGSGGPVTGKGCVLCIVDDPIKNAEAAFSESARQKNKDWWISTMRSRIENGGVAIIVQTRWMEDDLAGHIQKTERSYVLNLPALSFEEMDEEGFSVDPETGQRDLLGRKPGEALCPKLFTRSNLLRTRDLGDGSDGGGGAQWFSSLYQGKPAIEGGGQLGKPYRYFTTEKNFSGRSYFRTKDSKGLHRESYLNECIYYVTADLAVSTKTSADYTVFTLFAWTPFNQLLVVDVLRERIESTEHMRRAEQFWKACKARTGGAGVRFFGVESKTYGLSLLQALRKDARIPTKKLEADADKVARAIPIGMLNKNDQFFLPAGHELLPDIEKEMMIFPNGTHDDIVDTFGYGVRESLILPRRDLRKDDDNVPEQIRKKKRRKGRRHPIVGRIP